jgi:hypothetical protein
MSESLMTYVRPYPTTPVFIIVSAHGIKENFKLCEELCQQTDEKDFKKKLKDLERRTNEKGKEFLK